MADPCGENEGDCDFDSECQEGLKCGEHLGDNNCNETLGFNSTVDCCYKPALGTEYFCSSFNLCGENQGDCDYHYECQDDLRCGIDNCDGSLGFDSSIDCCYNRSTITNVTNGELGYCTMNYRCEENEGICETNDECAYGLACGMDNCPYHLGLNSTFNCCYTPQLDCINQNWSGDGWCDDTNNHIGCDWDGGDCCGDSVNTNYCDECECLQL